MHFQGAADPATPSPPVLTEWGLCPSLPNLALKIHPIQCPLVSSNVQLCPPH